MTHLTNLISKIIGDKSVDVLDAIEAAGCRIVRADIDVERVASATEKIVNDNWENGEMTAREQVALAAIEVMR